MSDLVHAKVKFKVVESGEDRKLYFLGQLVSDSWERDRLRGVYVDVLEGKVLPGGSRNRPHPYIKEGSVLRFNLVKREEVEALDEDDYEVEIIELTPEEREIVKAEQEAKERAEEIRRRAEIVKKLTKRLEATREDEEKAMEELAESMRQLIDEQEAKTQFEREQEQLATEGVESFFGIEVLPQKRSTHYFCYFKERVSRLCYATLYAYACASNGKYYINPEETRRGFLFKSEQSKDKFFREVSLDIDRWLQETDKQFYSNQMLTKFARESIRKRVDKE